MANPDQIRAAISERRWLDFLSDYELSDDAAAVEIRDAAVQLHNSGAVDILAAIEEFENGSQDVRFYAVQTFYASALPHINAQPQAMLAAVRRLVAEGGPNRDGAFIAPAFRDWCAVGGRASAIADLLDFRSERDPWYLRLAVEGAARADPDAALDWALALIKAGPPSVRHATLEALSACTGEDSSRGARALSNLVHMMQAHDNDLTLSHGLLAAVAIHGRSGAGEADVASIIDRARKFGASEVRQRGAAALWYQWKVASSPVRERLVAIVKTIPAAEGNALAMLDRALYQMAGGDELELAIEIVEAVLVDNDGELSIHTLSSFEHQLLSKHIRRFETLAAAWFVSGHQALGEAVTALVRKIHGEPVFFTVDLSTFGYGETELIFLSRKAIGYLFHTPVTAASLLLAVMRTGVGEAVKAATDLLADPLLINYSGDLSEYLRDHCQRSDDPATPHVAAALDRLERYVDGLRTVGRIKALDPSERERIIERRRHQDEMEAAMKEGTKESIFSLISTKIVLLYGNRSILYVEDPNGETRRLVSDMQSYSHSIEAARMIAVDPHGLDLMLRQFRVERLAR